MKRRDFTKSLLLYGSGIFAFKLKNVWAQSHNKLDINVEVGAKTVANKIGANNSSPAPDSRIGFGLKNIQDTINAITFNIKPQESNLIFLQKIAEQAPDGRRVPIEISTSLPKVERIAILFNKNPNITSGIFEFNENVEPYLYTSIKMQQSGILYVLVKSNNNWYFAKKVVKVLIGGCGA